MPEDGSRADAVRPRAAGGESPSPARITLSNGDEIQTIEFAAYGGQVRFRVVQAGHQDATRPPFYTVEVAGTDAAGGRRWITHPQAGADAVEISDRWGALLWAAYEAGQIDGQDTNL